MYNNLNREKFEFPLGLKRNDSIVPEDKCDNSYTMTTLGEAAVMQ